MSELGRLWKRQASLEKEKDQTDQELKAASESQRMNVVQSAYKRQQNVERSLVDTKAKASELNILLRNREAEQELRKEVQGLLDQMGSKAKAPKFFFLSN